MRRLYEWAVATGTGAERRVSPVGVTDEARRARDRMLEALGEIPVGVPACGWVTVVGYVPMINGYDRYQTPVRAERDPAGDIHAPPQGTGISAPGPARPQVYTLDGQRLRVLRLEHGLSQETLAYQAGISPATVARLERQCRASCRGRTLARLAVALGEQAGAITAGDGTGP